MSKPTSQFTRSCLVCGLEKPLAAFLQITGTQGTVYGNICSTCRSEAKDKSNRPNLPREDENTGGGAGLKIDSKAKVQQDIDKLKLRKKQQEAQHEHAEERKQLVLDKEERAENKIKAEKNHRNDYIEAQKRRGFLSDPQAKKQPLNNAFLNIQAQTEKTFISNQEVIETKRKEETFEQEIKAILDDPTQLYIDPRFGERKLQSLNFRQTKNRTVHSQFKSMQDLYKQRQESLQNQNKKSEQTKDPFTDYVEKTSKPGSTRGR